MGLKQAPPEGGCTRRPTYFTSAKTARGQTWHAYCAGPIHWFKCHELKRTKPCLKEISDGELSCPWCVGAVPVRTMGYAPLYRESDGMPVHVLLYDVCRDQFDKIKRPARVLVGRDKDPHALTYLTKALNQNPPYQTTLPERMRDADLTLSLVRLWAIPELSAWYTLTEGVSVPVPKLKEKEVNPVAENIATGVSSDLADWLRVAVEQKPDQLDRLRRHIEDSQKGQEAAKNGKHKPKG